MRLIKLFAWQLCLLYPARPLRSSDTDLLSVPRVRTCFGSRGFSVAAPRFGILFLLTFAIAALWLPSVANLKHSIFQRLAMSSAPSLLTPAPQIPRVSRRHCALYKLNLLTYLLTYMYYVNVVGIYGGFLLGVRSVSGLAFYDWETNSLVRRIEITPKLVSNVMLLPCVLSSLMCYTNF